MSEGSKFPEGLNGWDDWAEVDRLFDLALDLPSAERAAFLTDAAADPRVRAAVERLLQAVVTTGEFQVAISGELSAGGVEGASDSVGTAIGPFRIVRELGRGGMGSVYLAERQAGDFQQQVALKVLRRGVDTEDLLARFRAERRILAALRHPNIAALVDGGSTPEGRPWLAMEFVDGLPLNAWCRERQLPVRERITLVQRVARAVQEAHRNLVIHRDIKPANIMVTSDGIPKLLDFGIAKLLHDDAGSEADTRTGRSLLTPRYAAPEQRAGERATTATDVYQLGLLLVEIVTEHLPGLNEDRAGGLEGDLAQIATMACHEDPSRRYQTAGAFADELDRWLAGRPILARPDSVGYRTRKFLQRHRWVAPVATVAMVLIAGWGTTVIRQNAALERERTIAQEEAARAEEVLAFVLGLFNTANPVMLPTDGQWRELTVVDALQQGIPDIRARFADRPELQAELLGTIAEVLWGLEVQGRAEPLAGEAERLLAQATGDSSQARVYALARLARILSGTALTDSAAQLTEQVLAVHRQDPSTHRRAAVVAHGVLGRMASRRGEFLAAAGHYLDADAVIAGDSTFDAEATLVVVNGRLNTYLSLDSIGPAEEQARRAVAISQSRLGKRSLSHAIGLVNLARVINELGEDAEAVALYAEGIPLIAGAYGPEHSTTVSVRTNHATALRAAGRPQEAVAIMQELVARDTARPVEALDAGAADRLQNLGVFLVDAGDTATGMGYLRDAAAIYARETPASPRRVFPNLTLSAIALAQGDWQAAERDARTAVAALETALPPGHYATEVARCRVGRALLGRGAVEAAKSPLRTAGQRLAERAPETPYRPECLVAWADLERRVGAGARADSILRLVD